MAHPPVAPGLACRPQLPAQLTGVESELAVRPLGKGGEGTCRPGCLGEGGSDGQNEGGREQECGLGQEKAGLHGPIGAGPSQIWQEDKKTRVTFR